MFQNKPARFWQSRSRFLCTNKTSHECGMTICGTEHHCVCVYFKIQHMYTDVGSDDLPKDLFALLYYKQTYFLHEVALYLITVV